MTKRSCGLCYKGFVRNAALSTLACIVVVGAAATAACSRCADAGGDMQTVTQATHTREANSAGASIRSVAGEKGQQSRFSMTSSSPISSVFALSFDLSEQDKQGLLQLAKQTVEAWVRTKHLPTAPDPPLSDEVKKHRACFVTLKQQGSLRGCIGTLEAWRPLVEDVRENAIAAALRDPRFDPVTVAELGSLQYSISVLEAPKLLTGVTREELPRYLEQHRLGVIIEYQGRRSTFLPVVWEELTDPAEFLKQLCRKQGSPGDCWKNSQAVIHVYGALNFGQGH